jgi:hypothetical protein
MFTGQSWFKARSRKYTKITGSILGVLPGPDVPFSQHIELTKVLPLFLDYAGREKALKVFYQSEL